jgi:hypothetical protein
MVKIFFYEFKRIITAHIVRTYVNWQSLCSVTCSYLYIIYILTLQGSNQDPFDYYMYICSCLVSLSYDAWHT